MPLPTSGRTKGIASSPSIWNYNDTVRVLTCINDTVYSVTKNEITPAYIVNFGKYKVTREAFEDVRLLHDERSKYININPSFCETSRYVLTMFQYDNKHWVAVYDKQAAEISAWSIKPKNVNKYCFLEGGGWINDIDGAAATYLSFVSNDYFAINVQPEDLKAQFIKYISVKYPDKQQKLEKLIDSLNDDENPIIILYKLKK